MPTVTQIVTQIAPYSQFLASQDIANGALFGARINPILPYQIYIVRKSVQYRYDYEDIVGGSTPSVSLTFTANYLFSLCSKYGLQAQAMVNSGGLIPGTGGVTGYSIPISSQYVATTDGETVLTLKDVDGATLPSNSIVFWVQKSTTPLPLNGTQYSYDAPTLTLLDGISMGVDEILSFLYVVPV